MATQLATSVRSSLETVPLLDASNLPSADDWAILESLHVDAGEDLEPDFDRFGRFRLTASFDE